MITLLLSVGDTGLAVFIRQSAVAYPIISSLHIIGLGALVGAILLFNLSMMGFVRGALVIDATRLCSRLAAAGLFLALVSGGLLFSVQPATYLSNSAFLFKMTVLLLGVLHALLFHRLGHWQRLQKTGAVTHWVRTAALISLIIWISVIFAGRWIAFV